MVSLGFTFSKTPALYFGAGKFADIPELVSQFGKSVLLVTGKKSLQDSGMFDALIESFKPHGIQPIRVTVSEEPSPDIVDQIVLGQKGQEIHVVLAVGGGSVIDAGKAISAMLRLGSSVMDYLEGIGTKSHPGIKVPMIAVPTTSGTGSEATKNAVLSRVGKNGFKKSLRHDNFVPDIAVIDPVLTLSCPQELTAACGMDAITQLTESYVSKKSSPITDVLALGALDMALFSLIPLCKSDPNNVDFRSRLAYGSFISGITLANAGLGVVHGAAAILGSYFPIPHGVVCGTLLSSATRVNIQKLRRERNEKGLEKYAKMGRLFTYAEEREKKLEALIGGLEKFTSELKLPRLSDYGITRKDIDQITGEIKERENPVRLNQSELQEVLLNRL